MMKTAMRKQKNNVIISPIFPVEFLLKERKNFLYPIVSMSIEEVRRPSVGVDSEVYRCGS